MSQLPTQYGITPFGVLNEEERLRRNLEAGLPPGAEAPTDPIAGGLAALEAVQTSSAIQPPNQPMVNAPPQESAPAASPQPAGLDLTPLAQRGAERLGLPPSSAEGISAFADLDPYAREQAWYETIREQLPWVDPSQVAFDRGMPIALIEPPDEKTNELESKLQAAQLALDVAEAQWGERARLGDQEAIARIRLAQNAVDRAANEVQAYSPTSTKPIPQLEDVEANLRALQSDVRARRDLASVLDAEAENLLPDQTGVPEGQISLRGKAGQEFLALRGRTYIDPLTGELRGDEKSLNLLKAQEDKARKTAQAASLRKTASSNQLKVRELLAQHKVLSQQRAEDRFFKTIADFNDVIHQFDNTRNEYNLTSKRLNQLLREAEGFDPRYNSVEENAKRVADIVTRSGVNLGTADAETVTALRDVLFNDIRDDPGVKNYWDNRVAKVRLDAERHTAEGWSLELAGYQRMVEGAGQVASLSPVRELLAKGVEWADIFDNEEDALLMRRRIEAHNQIERDIAAFEGRDPELTPVPPITQSRFKEAANFYRATPRDLARGLLRLSGDSASENVLDTFTPEEKQVGEVGRIAGSLAVSGAAAAAFAPILSQAIVAQVPEAAAGTQLFTLLGSAEKARRAKRLITGINVATEATTFGLLDTLATGSAKEGSIGALFGVGVPAVGYVARQGGKQVAKLGQALSQASKSPTGKVLAELAGEELGGVPLEPIRGFFKGLQDNIISTPVGTEQVLPEALTRSLSSADRSTLESIGSIVGVQSPHSLEIPALRSAIQDSLTKQLNPKTLLKGLSAEDVRAVADDMGIKVTRKGNKIRRRAVLEKEIVKKAKGQDLTNIVAKHNKTVLTNELSKAQLKLERAAIPKLDQWLDGFDDATAAGVRREIAGAVEAQKLQPLSIGRAIRQVRTKYGSGRTMLSKIANKDGTANVSARVLAKKTSTAVQESARDEQTWTNTIAHPILINNRIFGDPRKGLQVRQLMEERIDPSVVTPEIRKAADELKSFFGMVSDLGKKENWQIRTETAAGAKFIDFKPRKNYIPHKFSAEVMDDLHKGGRKAEARVAQLFNDAKNADGSKVFKNIEDARQAMADEVIGETWVSKSISQGGIKSRKWGNIPDSMQENNLLRLTHDYSAYIARERALHKQFGKQRIGLRSLLNGIEKGAGADARQMVEESVLNPLFMKVPIDADVGHLINQISKAEFYGKIAVNPRLTVAQGLQPFLAATRYAGVRGILRGYKRFAQDVVNDALKRGDGWDLLKGSGIYANSTVDFMTDHRYSSVREGLWNWVVGRTQSAIRAPFVTGDFIARAVSGHAGVAMGEDLVRFIRGDKSFARRAWDKAVIGRLPLRTTEANNKWARSWITNHLGLDNVDEILSRVDNKGRWTGFTVDEKKAAIFNFATKTNFGTNVLEIPTVLRKTPMARFLSMFTSFGLKQAGETAGAARAVWKDPAQLISLSGGTLIAGALTAATGNLITGGRVLTNTSTPEGKLAYLYDTILASSVLGAFQNFMYANSARSFVPVVIGDAIEFVGNTFPTIINTAIGRQTVGELAQTIGRSHFPIGRQIENLSRLWNEEKANEVAWNQFSAAMLHASNVASGTTRWDKVKKELYKNQPGQGSDVYDAFLNDDPERLYRFLDNKMRARPDIRTARSAVVGALWNLAPMKLLGDVSFADLAVLAERHGKDLTDMKDRAGVHYMRYANWVAENWEAWKRERADTYGFDPGANPLETEGLTDDKVGPIRMYNFGNTNLWKTMPDEIRAMIGRKPQSYWNPLGQPGQDLIMPEDTIDEAIMLENFFKGVDRDTTAAIIREGRQRPGVEIEPQPVPLF